MNSEAVSLFKIMLISFKRIVKIGWKEFLRNMGISIATIFIMVMVISLVTMLFLLNPISDALISSIEDKVDISVYIKEDVSVEEIMGFKSEISRIPEVEDVDYISKEEALEIFIETHKDDPVLIESLTEVGYNPFLSSLNVRAWQASQYEQVSSFLETGNFQGLIEEIDYHQRKPVIERVSALVDGINKTGIFFSIIFGVIAILIAFNTVRIAIYSSKEEISVMKLVGASNWFVRGPFLIQGIIVGFISALIALLITFIFAYFLEPKVSSLVPKISIWGIFLSNLLFLFLIQLATGVGLGVISSYIAVRKYLRI